MSTGRWEKTLSDTLHALLRPGDSFLDIGAHIGYHSLTAAKLVQTGGRVIACEPILSNLALIQSSAAKSRLQNVTLVSVALSDACKPGKIHLGDLGNFATSSIRPVGQEGQWTLFACGQEVIPFEVWKQLRMLKLDVEGAEHLVLSGFRDHFEEWCPPYMIVEVTESFLRELGSSARALVDECCKAGYVPFWTTRQSSDVWTRLDVGASFQEQVDVLFVQHTHLDEASWLLGSFMEPQRAMEEVTCKI